MHTSKNYRHYSFDLWGTLIKSNPQFRNERANYFFKYYNPHKKSVFEILEILTLVDKMCNFANEGYGGNIHSGEMYSMAIYLLGHKHGTFDQNSIFKSKSDLDSLFLTYSPFIYSSETIPALSELKRRGKKLSILSNTAYTNGSILKEALRKLNLIDYFDFLIFSDEFGLSKPNPKLYAILRKLVDANTLSRDIIHVGDNPFADCYGAEDFGFDSFLINTNDRSISALL